MSQWTYYKDLAEGGTESIPLVKAAEKCGTFGLRGGFLIPFERDNPWLGAIKIELTAEKIYLLNFLQVGKFLLIHEVDSE